MTPTVQGFAWEGFSRSLQGDLTSFVGFIIFVLVALLVVRWSTNRMQGVGGISEVDARMLRSVAGTVAKGLVLVAIVFVGWRAVSVASINRMPRADVDRSGVYEQMNTLTNR